jgi:hypothetical protein
MELKNNSIAKAAFEITISESLGLPLVLVFRWRDIGVKNRKFVEETVSIIKLCSTDYNLENSLNYEKSLESWITMFEKYMDRFAAQQLFTKFEIIVVALSKIK